MSSTILEQPSHSSSSPEDHLELAGTDVTITLPAAAATWNRTDHLAKGVASGSSSMQYEHRINGNTNGSWSGDQTTCDIELADLSHPSEASPNDTLGQCDAPALDNQRRKFPINAYV